MIVLNSYWQVSHIKAHLSNIQAHITAVRSYHNSRWFLHIALFRHNAGLHVLVFFVLHVTVSISVGVLLLGE